MDTILIRINNEKAYKLLEDLQALDIITLLKKDTTPALKLSDKYKGVFSKEDAESFNKHTQIMRKEWDNT